MLNWPVFLTAGNASAKTLNKAWIELQDYEFTDGDHNGSWVLLTSKTLPEQSPQPTRLLAVEESYQNHSLANATLDEVNTFIRAHESQLQDLDITAHHWIIFDQQSLETDTCILAEQVFDEEKMELSNGFRALRIARPEAWSCFANLDIANMGFEDFADLDAGLLADGTYPWVGPFEPSNAALERADEEQGKKREAALKAARELGHID